MRALQVVASLALLTSGATLVGCGSSDTFSAAAAGAAGASGGSGGLDGGGASGSAGASGAAGVGGLGGAAGGANDGGKCDPSGAPRDNPCGVTDALGVFIDAQNGNDNTGNGSRAKPFQSFAVGAAAAAAGGKRLFACAGTYAESVTLDTGDKGLSIFGGFDCTSWNWTGKRTEVRPGTPGPALKLDSAQNVLVEDIDFRSEDASNHGESSIAVIIASSESITVRRGKIHAGSGGPGPDAVTPSTPVADGAPGNGGTAAACLQASPGGPTAITTCGVAARLHRRQGRRRRQGFRERWRGRRRHAGSGRRRRRRRREGGRLELRPGRQRRHGQGRRARHGRRRRGVEGHSRARAATRASPAMHGGPGNPGQGGGGGGGAKAAGGLACTILTSYGASGGGGGGGGCGGGGSPGGGPGGSSIAILSIASDVAIEGATVEASAGGNGGKGAAGQPGGNGGTLGAGGGGKSGSAAGCAGGAGGRGGAGGPGGGGAGGHSLGIAYTGSVPLVDATSNVTFGVAGTGGLDGLGTGAEKGVDGLAKIAEPF